MLDEPGESLKGILPVALLTAELSGVDHQIAIGGHVAGGEPDQPVLNVGLERARGANVEPELDRRRDLVDVLAAGA